MNRFLKALGAGLAITTILVGCSPQPNQADKVDNAVTQSPALWLVKDVDTNVYLFGTVHVLKPETIWQTDAFSKTFSAIDVLYQEADVSTEVQQQLTALLPPLAFYSDGRTLMEVLDEAEEKEVLEAAALVGLPQAALNRMKPWFAALGLSQMQMMKNGYRATSGVDPILAKKAKRAGKPIRYFETAKQQLHMLADLPEDSQIDFLVAGSEAIEDNPHQLDELVGYWEKGDVEAIAKLMSDQDSLGGKVLLQTLLIDRNKIWVKDINALMDAEAGTFMIAVGAAHLAGEDSVVDLLRDQGEMVVRQ